MILVSAFYAITWAPICVYYLLVNLDAINLTLVESDDVVPVLEAVLLRLSTAV